MRILGIDYGSKNIGISLSDERGEWAFPHSVLPNDKKTTDTVLKITSEKGVKEVVIGESKDFKGKANEILAAASGFAKPLAAASLVIHFEPEYLTSHQAQHIQGRTAMIDASAATIILQSFLDKRKNKNTISK
jgi:putative Holliday junction resolvase